ncbi:MAG: amidohydrolase [Candidatus Thermoplasmatota archaeon]|nr:amidohydrolase [Candidatus Thermoplasmatota archaeon]MBU1941393.1 amidohydrolase [Candidatus Thermoplasmatota archaeon]
MSILIKNATILTQNQKRKQLYGDIYIDHHVIQEISQQSLSIEAEYVIDASQYLAIPGLINTHTHIPMTLLRGYGDDMLLHEWLEQRIWPVEAKLTQGAVQIGTDLGLLEMIASGTTCFVDMYFFEDSVAQSTIKAGLRGFLGFAFIDIGTPEYRPEELVSAGKRFISRWKNHDLIQPIIAPHSVYTCSPETLQQARDIAEKHSIMLHTHCSETRENVYDVQKQYGVRPVQHLKNLGLLHKNMLLAHCGWITKNEVQDIKKAGSSISHCPVSNMKIATGGFAPIPECLEAGVAVGLGTDGAASNNVLDMFDTMKFCALIHKNHRWDPRVLPAQTVFDCATIQAAQCLNMDKQIGSIEEGKYADIVLVDMHQPHFYPQHDHVSNLIYVARGGDVVTTIVNGQLVMHDRMIQTLDTEKILSASKTCAEELTK